MTLGVIGAGHIGQALARQALRAGHQVILANSRGPDSLAGVAAGLGPGASAGTVAQAAASDLVAIAVPWSAIPDAVTGIDWDGRIVIDATNPITDGGAQVADLGGRTSSEIVSELLPRARLVKAANTLPAAVLAADPWECDGRRVLTLCGDDDEAKTVVAELFDAAGFATINLGGLVSGGRLQQVPGGAFPALNLLQLARASYDEARRAWNLAADVVQAVRFARSHGMRVAAALGQLHMDPQQPAPGMGDGAFLADAPAAAIKDRSTGPGQPAPSAGATGGLHPAYRADLWSLSNVLCRCAPGRELRRGRWRILPVFGDKTTFPCEQYR